MREAVDHGRTTRWRGFGVEAEQGQDAVHVHQEQRPLFRIHQGGNDRLEGSVGLKEGT
jgi:hypothetical protein